MESLKCVNDYYTEDVSIKAAVFIDEGQCTRSADKFKMLVQNFAVEDSLLQIGEKVLWSSEIKSKIFNESQERNENNHLRPTGLEVFSRLDVPLDNALTSPQSKIGFFRIGHFDGHIWHTNTNENKT